MEDDKIQLIKSWLGTGSINIFGRPFAGKDTQGKKLAQLFDGVLLGGGDILRGSTIPDHVKEHMHAGRLIPSDEYVRIVLPYLSQETFANKPLILSSVGRWANEETGVMKAAKASQHPLKVVFYLNLSEEEVRKRWQALDHHNDRGGRHDDNNEVLETRLNEFATKTIPVIEAYRALGLLIEIDGALSQDEVTEQLVKSLLALAR